MELVLLRGGSRDGETTTVEHAVRRIYAASAAAGLLDVFEDGGEREHVRGNEEAARVFRFAGQVPSAGIAPELIHLPPGR